VISWIKRLLIPSLEGCSSHLAKKESLKVCPRNDLPMFSNAQKTLVTGDRLAKSWSRRIGRIEICKDFVIAGLMFSNVGRTNSSFFNEEDQLPVVCLWLGGVGGRYTKIVSGVKSDVR